MLLSDIFRGTEIEYGMKRVKVIVTYLVMKKKDFNYVWK